MDNFLLLWAYRSSILPPLLCKHPKKSYDRDKRVQKVILNYLSKVIMIHFNSLLILNKEKLCSLSVRVLNSIDQPALACSVFFEQSDNESRDRELLVDYAKIYCYTENSKNYWKLVLVYTQNCFI